MTGPVLRTARLVLHPLTTTVAAALAGDPAAVLGRVGLAPGEGFPTEVDAGLLALFGARPAAEDTGTWLVSLEGRVVGMCGRKGAVDPVGDLEIGYGLAPAAQGRGLAGEAVGALCDHLAGSPGVRRLVAEVLPGNVGSRRLLERLGFTQQPGGGSPYLWYARLAGPPTTVVR